MKRNDWKILLGALLFTLLFYKQLSGLNFLLFSCFLVITSAVNSLELLIKPSWIVAATGTLISAAFVFIYGTSLPIITNILSLVLLAGFSFSPSSSFIVAGIHSALSLASALPFIIIKRFQKKGSGSTENSKGGFWHKSLLLVLPLLIVALFFSLYRGASPEFMEFTEDVNLKWISLPLIRFFALGLIVLYGFYCQKVLHSLVNIDRDTTDAVLTKTEEERSHTFLGKKLSVGSEVFIGTSLLLMLNLLIALVNVLDISKVWTNPVLPETDTYSSFLHSGVSMLILSIVLAIGIILFFFRSYLNFYPKNKILRLLGFVWIIQNIVLIISTAIRNNMYVDAYALSHKRIGVFIYLALCIIGLIFTFIKLLHKKNNWFLLRKNTWAFYLFMVVCSTVNWDMIITNFNIKHAKSIEDTTIDLAYLSRLSDVNTASLIPFNQDIDLNDVFLFNQSFSNTSVNDKFNAFLSKQHKSSWQSTCLNHNAQMQAIKRMNESRKIKYLDLSTIVVDDLTAFSFLSNIEGLWLNNSYGNLSLNVLNHFLELKTLNLSSNNLEDPVFSLRDFPLDRLTHLNLSDNPIESYGFMQRFPNLTHLDLSNNLNQIAPKGFPKIASLSKLDMSSNNWGDWGFLESFPNLESLEIAGCYDCNFLDSIPRLDSLKEIYFNQTSIGLVRKSSLLSSIDKSAPNIELVMLSDNHLDSISKMVEPNLLFPKISHLYLSSNKIIDADTLASYKHLQLLSLHSNLIERLNWEGKSIESLDLSKNPLKQFTSSVVLENLKELKLRETEITEIHSLPSAPNLASLDISNTAVNNLDSIIRFSSIVNLNISGTKVKDLTPLSGLKELKKLHINQLYQLNYEDLPNLNAIENIYVEGLSKEIIDVLKLRYPAAEIHHSYNNDYISNLSTRY